MTKKVRTTDGTPTAVLLCTLLLVATSCDVIGPDDESSLGGEPIETSDGVAVSDSVKELFQADAARLFLRSRGDHHAEEEVEISGISTAAYYYALLAAYRMEHPLRDSIRGIHTYPRPELHELAVWLEPGTEWADAWARGGRLTGNASVDHLLQTYQLELVSFNRDAQRMAILRSPLNLNMQALSARFADIYRVRSAEPIQVGGDGDDVYAQKRDGYVQLVYSRGYGDCSRECEKRRWWIFRVRYDNEMSYMGAYER